jgi:hypothetical protein
VCSDTTDIVGYRTCTPYGVWSRNLRIPNIIAEIGMTFRQFANPLREGDGQFSHNDENFTYHVVSGGSGSASSTNNVTGVALSLRLGAGIAWGFYAAAEGELGGVAGADQRAEMLNKGTRGTPELEHTSTVLAQGGGVFGWQAHQDRFGVSAEIAGGGRVVQSTYQSTYGACVQSSAVSAGQAYAEGRVRAAYWFNTFGQVGVTAGKSLIDSSWMTGVFIGGQSRSFGGR